MVGGMDKGSIIGVKLECDRRTHEFTVNDRKYTFEKRTIGLMKYNWSETRLRPRDARIHGERPEAHLREEDDWTYVASIIGVKLDCDREALKFTMNDRTHIFEKGTIGFR
ncbi:hypothetical protein Q1695_013335 [Nippostrongylus brasiliensis]|nr:hypothetical protein Q1695_013335 [Nippostrongylus brasiliensis]